MGSNLGQFLKDEGTLTVRRCWLYANFHRQSLKTVGHHQ